MYVHIHTYTKHFSMTLKNFILIKRRWRTTIIQNGDPSVTR